VLFRSLKIKMKTFSFATLSIMLSCMIVSPSSACNPCSNGGTFDGANAKCVCTNKFIGSRCQVSLFELSTTICESPNCNNYPKDDAFCASFSCDNQLGKTLCPEKCLCRCPVVKKCVYGTFDYNTCSCKCANHGFSGDLCENFDCTNENIEDPVCASLTCSDTMVVSKCPKKCMCKPATTTPKPGTCLPCFNGGSVDLKTCVCKCPSGFGGDRCQFLSNPCNAEDPLECNTLNCFAGDEDVLYKCQKKCLCCGNLQCKNFGELFKNSDTDKCQCRCFDDEVYDENKLCDIKECRDVLPACGVDLTAENCYFPFVATACPLMCGDCEP